MASAPVAMIALQGRGGLVFGSVTRWQPRRVAFAVGNELGDADAHIEFRMELAGQQQTVLGRLVPGPAQPEEGLFHYTGAIVGISDEDQPAYEAWAEAMSRGRGGTVVFAWSAAASFGLGGMNGTTPEERERAFKALDERRRLRADRARQVLSANLRRWPDPHERPSGDSVWVPFAAPSEDAPIGVHLAPPPRVVPMIAAPAPAPRPAPAEVARPSAPAEVTRPPAPPVLAAPTPPVPPARPPRPDPTTEVLVFADGPTLDLSVRWTHPERFATEVEAHLRYGALTLPGRFLRANAHVRATLVTPRGRRVVCEGRVALVDDDGTGVALVLSAVDRAVLREG